MMDARIARCKATRLRRQSSAGDDPARLDPPHPWLIAPAKPPLDALSLALALPEHPHTSRSRPILPGHFTLPTMPPAAQSP
jgi:hypothetical protein